MLRTFWSTATCFLLYSIIALGNGYGYGYGQINNCQNCIRFNAKLGLKRQSWSLKDVLVYKKRAVVPLWPAQQESLRMTTEITRYHQERLSIQHHHHSEHSLKKITGEFFTNVVLQLCCSLLYVSKKKALDMHGV